MLVSYKWLQDYVLIQWSPKTLARKLTENGLEVKSVESNPLDSGDAMLEIEITSNRPDCLGMIGIAREIAAISNQKIKLPQINLIESDEPAGQYANIIIESPDLCPRYCARIIQNVKIQESPDWLKYRLESVGIRAINNIVDLTNYVLLEYGHPMHAFDLDKLVDRKIIVRRARPDETILTLDGQHRKLDEDRLVIADINKPVALAGVMGGANSEVIEQTNNLLLESACFDPVSIRKTSKILGLRTESSYRFERGTDPENAFYALNRLAGLIQKTTGCKIAKNVLDIYPKPEVKKCISLRVRRTNQILGTKIKRKTIITILENLNCQILPVQQSNLQPDDKTDLDKLWVEIPGIRRDLIREIDLIEEIARIYGYEKISNQAPVTSIYPVQLSIKSSLERSIRDFMISLGFWEVMNHTLVNSNEWNQLGVSESELVKLRNPLSQEQNILRTSLLPGLIKNISDNIHFGRPVVRIFEIGQVMKNYIDKTEFMEWTECSIAAVKKPVGAIWEEKGVSIDFYGFKGILEELFRILYLPEPEFYPIESIFYKKGISAQIYISHEPVGCLGQINPELAKKYTLENEGYCFTLNLDKLCQFTPRDIHYQPLPKYPAIERDISLLVPFQTTADEIKKQIMELKTDWIESVELFDLYSGNKISDGFRSLSFRIRYRHPKRTLQDSDIHELHEKIIRELIHKYQIQIRK